MKTIVTPRSGVSDWLVSMPTGAVEATLPGGCKQLLKKTGDWYTVAYRLEPDRIVVRGRRGDGQFLAAWRAGKADCAYWWTRHHEAWADLPRQHVTWQTPRPAPVKVGFRELGKLLQAEV